MSLLSGKEARSNTAGSLPCEGIYVGGMKYDNSAAKFWANILQEVSIEYSECSRLYLSAYSCGELDRRVMFPEIALQRTIENLADQDIAAIMRQTLTELEVFGDISPVDFCLSAGDQKLHSGHLPLDCVDAEIFSYLLAWILDWSHCPETEWRDELISSNLSLEDRCRGVFYGLAFEIRSSHLSEGLYRRSIVVDVSNHQI